jgi:hypothetical protein
MKADEPRGKPTQVPFLLIEDTELGRNRYKMAKETDNTHLIAPRVEIGQDPNLLHDQKVSGLETLPN